MTISVNKEFNQKSENWKEPHLNFSEKVRDTKSGICVSNEYLPNLTYGKLTAFTICPLFSNNQLG